MHTVYKYVLFVTKLNTDRQAGDQTLCCSICTLLHQRSLSYAATNQLLNFERNESWSLVSVSESKVNRELESGDGAGRGGGHRDDKPNIG